MITGLWPCWEMCRGPSLPLSLCAQAQSKGCTLGSPSLNGGFPAVLWVFPSSRNVPPSGSLYLEGLFMGQHLELLGHGYHVASTSVVFMWRKIPVHMGLQGEVVGQLQASPRWPVGSRYMLPFTRTCSLKASQGQRGKLKADRCLSCLPNGVMVAGGY